MAGPPQDVDASELWSALTTLPRPHRNVDFPRADLPMQVAIWVLTQEERNLCAAEAERYAKLQLKEASGQTSGLGYQALYENEAALQFLWRACRDPNKLTRPAFPSASLMRAKLTGDEIGVLMRLYIQVQHELGPIAAACSSLDEEEAWIRRLAEGGSTFPIASLSEGLQERLMLSMASQLVSFWTGTSSPGSPLGEQQASDNGAVTSDAPVEAVDAE